MPSRLSIRLSNTDVQTLQGYISRCQAIGSKSINSLITDLNADEQTVLASDAFKVIRDHLSFVEGICAVTYDDSSGCDPSLLGSPQLSNGAMTIGIGLNIQDPNAEALFHKLDPYRDWNFKFLQTHTGEPRKNPLTQIEVSKLLRLTFIGASWSEKGLHYPGQLSMIRERLAAYGLDDVAFPYNQLLALISTGFNRLDLLGDNLRTALQEMPTKGPMNVLIELMEQSNRAKDIGLENRRLKDSYLFLGNEIVLDYRMLQMLLAIHPDAILDNGPAIYPLPFADLHQTFTGNKTLSIEPGRDQPHHNDKIYYGTTGNDVITHQADTTSDPVLLGGDGDDILTVNSAKYPYLAGGRGDDTYILTSNSGKAMIYDSDNRGRIKIDGEFVEGIAFEENNAYVLTVKNRRYQLNSVSNDNNYPSLSWQDASNAWHEILLPNFNFGMGQFNMALGNRLGSLTPKQPEQLYTVMLTSGHIVQTTETEVYVYSPEFELINTFTVDSHANALLDITALAQGQFIIQWQEIGSDSRDISTYVNMAAVGNPSQLSPPFVVDKCYYNPYSGLGCQLSLNFASMTGLSDGSYVIPYIISDYNRRTHFVKVKTPQETLVIAIFDMLKANPGWVKVQAIHDNKFMTIITVLYFGKTEFIPRTQIYGLDEPEDIPGHYFMATAAQPEGFILLSMPYSSEYLDLQPLSFRLYHKMTGWGPIKALGFNNIAPPQILSSGENSFICWNKVVPYGPEFKFSHELILIDSQGNPIGQPVEQSNMCFAANRLNDGNTVYINAKFEMIRLVPYVTGYSSLWLRTANVHTKQLQNTTEEKPHPPLASSAQHLQLGFLFNLFSYSSSLLNQGLKGFNTWFTQEAKANNQALIIHPNVLQDTSKGLFDDEPETVQTPPTAQVKEPIIGSYVNSLYTQAALLRVTYEMGRNLYRWWTGEAKREREAAKAQAEQERLSQLKAYGHNPYAKLYLETLYKLDIGLGDEEDFAEALTSLATEQETDFIKLLELALLAKENSTKQALKGLPKDLRLVLLTWAEEAHRVVLTLPKADGYLDRACEVLAQRPIQPLALSKTHSVSSQGLFKPQIMPVKEYASPLKLGFFNSPQTKPAIQPPLLRLTNSTCELRL